MFRLKVVSLLIFGVLISHVHLTDAKIYHMAEKGMNWFKASEYCRSIGMRLITINSQEENEELAGFVKQTNKFEADGCSFWLGGSDLGEEGCYTWSGTGRKVTFANWSPGEPNNMNNAEHCLQLVYIPRFNQSWTWNDIECHKTMYFVCEDTGCLEDSQ
ncbi:perlucin-like [Uranotaenia lowii]|uniref:perlucin-like n=1 Tax=Uranotaenia lowii TaxID=190385 RepID=UPI002478E6A2|nr:perlucin-like [Uranotaenia lowii]